MSDMYSKLGDLLNEALENGEIPQKKADKTVSGTNNTYDFCRKNEQSIKIDEKVDKENTGTDHIQTEQSEENTKKLFRKISFFTQKSHISRGEIIKMHKYTQNMHITPEILQALSTLDIAYPVNWNIIKKQYHKLLKKYHPDTKNTIQSSKIVQNSEHSIEEIKNAYNTLKEMYNK